MRIGGIAKYVLEIEDVSDLPLAREFCQTKNLKHYFLGIGANTFATDAGFDGVIIINKIKGITQSSNKFVAYGGETWTDFVLHTVELGYSGVECLAGIPGTVGAAPVQNIGAYGQEVATTITKVLAYDFELGEEVEIENKDCDFSYRHSIFNSEKRGKYFIYAVEFELKKGEAEGELYNSLQQYLDANNITSRDPLTLAKAVMAVRDSKLPDPNEVASSGSFFKNVYVDESEIASLDERGIPHHGTKVNTGWLLENAGLKGKDFYGFKISDKAALVLINESAKSYADLERAVKEIQKIVYEKFGFMLEQEPNVIGEEND